MIHTIMVRESLEDPGSWLESSVNHSFVAMISRIDLMGMGGLGLLGLLTSWIFLLEIECNKTMIQTTMVPEGLEDPCNWLESSVNHSFVALIFRIVLEGMGGLGLLGLLTSWIFLLEIECNKTMIQTIMVQKRVRGSHELAREHCESLFCCIDFQNSFGEG
jgi:hypothetical protein